MAVRSSVVVFASPLLQGFQLGINPDERECRFATQNVAGVHARFVVVASEGARAGMEKMHPPKDGRRQDDL
jgi:hypothetical protein